MARMVDGMEQLLRGEAPHRRRRRRSGCGWHRSKRARRWSSSTPRTHANPMGTVQGGILAAIADAAMGWAYMTTLGEGESYTTLEIKTNFLRPVRAGRLSARARVRNAGRTVGLVECDVTAEDGKVVAYAVSTCMILRGEAAAGR